MTDPSRSASAVRDPVDHVIRVAAFAVAVGCVIGVGFRAGETRGQARDPSVPTAFADLDPEKVVSAEACGECHVSEYEVWKRTTHQTGFRTLHKKEAAETIARKMGFRLLKRDSLCLSCHYTATVQKEELRAISGVSCESCHGAARDWLDVHNEYGGKGIDHTNESAEHRRMRIEKSLEAGMRRPSDSLYALTSRCFECHTVPNETLVNQGGHGTGSGDFDLVERLGGEIRHNFLDSFLNGDGTTNAERPMTHNRRLFVLGRALALEHGLRAMAEATEKGVFAQSTSRRIRKTLRDVRSLERRLELPELATMVNTVRDLDIRPGRRQAMLAAADTIGDATRRFLDRHDGQQLASLDPVILGTEDIELAEEEDEAEDELTAIADGGAGTGDGGLEGGTIDVGTGDGGTGDGGASTTADGGTGDAASTARARLGDGSRPAGESVVVDPGVPAVGEFKRKIRPVASRRTLGPENCVSCHRHQDQAAWWYDDPHSLAADPFLEQSPKNIKIATLYGLKRSQIGRGDHVCMDCHGTVVSGSERREVDEGVGCESCHGPAADYLEVHQEGDASLGDDRPGYRQALAEGMLALRDLDVRAKTCTGCHYITEPRLISAGHPSGRNFDYADAMTRINHWDHPSAAAGAITAAFQNVLGSRGPVPQVARARLASRRTVGGALTEPLDAGIRATQPRTPRARPHSRAGQPRAGQSRAGQSRAGQPRAGQSRAGADTRPTPNLVGRAPVGDLNLPPFPEVDEDASVESMLLMLKARLELLYEVVDGERNGDRDRPGDNR